MLPFRPLPLMFIGRVPCWYLVNWKVIPPMSFRQTDGPNCRLFWAQPIHGKHSESSLKSSHSLPLSTSSILIALIPGLVLERLLTSSLMIEVYFVWLLYPAA